MMFSPFTCRLRGLCRNAQRHIASQALLPPILQAVAKHAPDNLDQRPSDVFTNVAPFIKRLRVRHSGGVEEHIAVARLADQVNQCSPRIGVVFELL